MTTDSVGDALIRIKNGYMARKGTVELPYSKLIISVIKVLEKEGYITKLEEVNNERVSLRKLIATLKYDQREPAMSDVKRVSKPGLRVYKGASALPYVLNGMGIALISTPKGIMTDKQARKAGLGGEVMAYVW